VALYCLSGSCSAWHRCQSALSAPTITPLAPPYREATWCLSISVKRVSMNCTHNHSGLTMTVEYDPNTEMLNLNDDVIEAEFRLATRQAIENNEVEFDFHGFIVETDVAIDVVNEMKKLRGFH
jgi:hypothetical protein